MRLFGSFKCRKSAKICVWSFKKKALKILLKNKEKNTSDEGVQLQEMMRVDFYTHVRESLLCICCCWWSSSLLLKVALIFDWRHFFIHHGYYFTGCPDKFWIRKLRNKTIFKSSKSLILVQYFNFDESFTNIWIFVPKF